MFQQLFMNSILGKKKGLFLILIAMIGLDWFIKKWVVISGIPHNLNTGIAFGVLDGSGLGIILAIVGLIVVFVLFKYENNCYISFLFIIAGAIGNIIDRFLYSGVIDYINVFNIPWFNLADVFINTGIVLYIYCAYVSNRNSKKIIKNKTQ